MGSQRESKRGGDVPEDHSKAACEPAECGVGMPSNRYGGCTQQDERGGDKHEQQMLHHVCRQEVMVEVGDGRRNGYP
jgi:hypothetical protein